MQPSTATSPLYGTDQRTTFTVDFWDTPYTAMENGFASNGIIMDVREPLGGNRMDAIATNIGGATPSATLDAFNNDNLTRTTVSDGRIDNLIEYWAGGAPGWRGVTRTGQVAYHFRLYLRPQQARSWGAGSDTPAFSIAMAGNGFVRINKCVSGTYSTVSLTRLREEDYLLQDSAGGMTFTPVITDVASGDYLDIYYVQSEEAWGGFVFKAVEGSVQTQDLAREAPVIGCGIFDTGSLPTKHTLKGIEDLTIDHGVGRATTATFRVSVVNPERHDGFGWEWYRAAAEDPGELRMWDGGNVGVARVPRHRLVQVTGGVVGAQYVMFTGTLHDYEDPADGKVTIQCHGFEKRYLTRYNKQYPNKISYMARGYRKRSGTSEPVYEIPAYDNWPIEHLIEDLGVWAGVDAMHFRRQLYAPKADGTQVAVVIEGESFKKFRARSLAGTLLRTERQIHYGNYGSAFSESRPTDDAYIFRPEATKEVWHQVQEIAEKYGYDVRFDEFGHAILAQRNNAHAAYDAVPADFSGAASQLTNPAAFKGTYVSNTGDGNFVKTVTGARIDIVTPRIYGEKGWSYTVERTSDAGVVASGTLSPAAGVGSSDDPLFFYDSRTAVDGTNSCVATLWSGDFNTYTIRMYGDGGGTAQSVDSVFVYHTDPNTSRLPVVLATSGNALQVIPRSTMDTMRNYTVVVGQRRATVTDSDKLETNPDNPEHEFIVSTAVDSDSINQPLAKNFVGTLLEQVLHDTKVTSQDLADYLARVLTYRQRMPAPSAQVTHTVLPNLQQRDPILVSEDTYGAITAARVLYVTGLRHRFEASGKATTEIETSSYPEFASYEPREDIDIDANFGGNPVVNIEVSYTSLTGDTQTNLPTQRSGATSGTVLSDSYNRTNSTTSPGTADSGHTYTSIGFGGTAATWGIDTNQLYIATPGNNYSGLSVETGEANGRLSCTFYNPGNNMGVFFRSTDGDNLFMLEWVNDNFHFHRRQAGAWTQITSWAAAYIVSGSVVNIDLDGESIIIRHGETLLYSHTDSFNVAATIHGPSGYGGLTVRYDNLSFTVTTTIAAGVVRKSLDAYTSPTRPEGDWQLEETLPVTVPGTGFPYIDLPATSPWPPVPGTVFIRPADGAGMVGEEHDVGLNLTSDGSAEGSFFYRVPGQRWPVNLTIRNLIAIDRVYIQMKSGPNSSNVFEVDADDHRGTDKQFYWEWDPIKEEVAVYYKQRYGITNNMHLFKARVEYRVSTNGATPFGWMTNTPYRHIMNVDYRQGTGATGRRIYLPFEFADGKAGSGITDHQRPTDITHYDVRWRRLGPTDVDGNFDDPYAVTGSPFYDPYTSELGYLVGVTYDALVSGQYRISVRSLADDTVVAWLTEPTADPAAPDAHWAYVTAGASKRAYWDGVDQVGEYNQRMSEPYATAAHGAFEQDQRPVIGKGFYVWNQEHANGTPGPLALIAGDLDVAGKPVFGHGTYSAFYVHFEVRNDVLESIAASQAAEGDPTKQVPRIVRTDALDDTFNDVEASDPCALIYTHLPEPTRLSLEISDWVGAAFDETNTAAINTGSNWGAADADAILNNQKPVRLRMALGPRPGVLWTNKQDRVTGKLTRFAHLKASIFDQFVVHNGSFHPDTTVEQAAVYSRRLMNDSHTFAFADDSFRRAGSLKTTDGGAGSEWIFLPRHCKKNWVGSENAPLMFGDYLQLEEVPGFDPNRAPAGKRARFQIAFMSYLFYLSAMVQDRSGRFAWGVNRHFLDKSKILKNAYADWFDPASATYAAATSTTYRVEDVADPMTQHRRTIITRQWSDEGSWQAQQRTRWGFSVGSLGDKLLRHKWQDHEPGSATLNGTAWPTLDTDKHTEWHVTGGRTELPTSQPPLELLPSSFYDSNTLTRQLGVNGEIAPRLGNWTWETGPLWIPCISRDFAPYHIVPPMTDPPTGSTHRLTNIYRLVDYRKYDSGANTGNDAAAGDVWSSPVCDMTETATNRIRFWPGRKLDKKAIAPTDTLSSNELDYGRQDECVHFEDLRGIFSRGPRPSEQPKKITPVTPYFVNLFEYDYIRAKQAYKNPGASKFEADMRQVFDMKFRAEYFWESGSLFPCDHLGREVLAAVNHSVTRYEFPQASGVRWDSGAWTGWKDDTPVIDENDSYYCLAGAAFGTGHMPFQVGPRLLGTTKDMLFHMVLVNERRATPLGV